MVRYPPLVLSITQAPFCNVSRDNCAIPHKNKHESEDAMGGVEKRGGRKTSRMTSLPKGGFGPPPWYSAFPPRSGVSALFFLYTNARQSRTEALLEGSKNFRESVCSGTFSSPHTFCTPPYHGPNERGLRHYRYKYRAIWKVSLPGL